MSFNDYIYGLRYNVKNEIIYAIRHYFENYSEFKKDNSNIQIPAIYDEIPLINRTYPNVIIKNTGGQDIPLGLDRDFIEDVWSDDLEIPRVIAERRGYAENIGFQLQVQGDTTPVRDRMVDNIIAALKFIERQYLLNRGIRILTVSPGGDTLIPLDTTRAIYQTTISITVYAEQVYDTLVDAITAVTVLEKHGWVTDYTPHS